MSKLQKILIFQKVSVFFSIIAFCLSVFSIISVNKMKFSMHNSEVIQNKFKPIKDIPDVEVIKPDGSVEKVNAFESKDELVKILKHKSDKDNAQNKKENKDINSKDNNLVNKTSIQNDNDNKKSNNKKIIRPVSRSEKNVVVKNNKNVVKVNNNQSRNNQKRNDGNLKNKIYGNFVVQIGAFKDRATALKQCSNVSKNLSNKNCNIATTNNVVFRSIVYPFENYNEAIQFSDMLSAKTKINCLVKKNG